MDQLVRDNESTSERSKRPEEPLVVRTMKKADFLSPAQLLYPIS